MQEKLLYQKLTEYLLGFLPQSYYPNFYSWMSKVKIINEGKTIVEHSEYLSQTIVLCEIEYEALLWFEALPFKQVNPLKIMAALNVWVQECEDGYPHNNNQQIEGELTPIDDDTADLDFTLTFREPIYLVESKDGDIFMDGKLYKLGEVEIYSLDNLPIRARFLEYKNRK